MRKSVRMVGPKVQTRVVGIIMGEMHPYISFSSKGISMKNVMDAFRLYHHYSYLCTFWPCHPYTYLLQFI